MSGTSEKASDWLKMSKSTTERIAVLETKLDLIHEKLDEFINCADKKYAGKLAERIIYGMVGFILVFVLGRIINIATTNPAVRAVTSVFS